MYMCMSRMVSPDSILRIINNVIIVNIVMIFHEYILLKQQRQQLLLHRPGFQRQQLLLHRPGFQFAVHFSSDAPAVKFKAVCCYSSEVLCQVFLALE